LIRQRNTKEYKGDEATELWVTRLVPPQDHVCPLSLRRSCKAPRFESCPGNIWQGCSKWKKHDIVDIIRFLHIVTYERSETIETLTALRYQVVSREQDPNSLSTHYRCSWCQWFLGTMRLRWAAGSLPIT
jgi:hypothetical protein